MKGRYFTGASAVAVAAGLLSAGAAQAQDARPNTVDEVVVTGSFIQGTPKDTAIPVAVLNQEDLEKRGSPSILDIIKTLPISGPVLGDSN